MINTYIENLSRRYKNGNTTEHSFRGDLQKLFEDHDSNKELTVTNEPKRIECGAPDFIVTKKKIPLGYIEAKDIGIPLDKTEKSEQLKRYRQSLPNLILTDYLEFRLYRNGKPVTSVKIAEVKGKAVVPLPDSFKDLENLIRNFCTHVGQTIESHLKLAEMMAGKARMMQAVIEKAVTGDEENEQDSTLKDQMTAFQKILIHDIKPSEFADIYAQTIAYGMFAARLYDETLEDFSRQEAAELIPKSNPFLRSLFIYIAGPDIDDRILWIVDDLVDIFRFTNVAKLMENFGSAEQKKDPVIHFYETFLAKYNPKLRKSRGVWYTPEPVVKFIVRAVDDILKTEFGLPRGLADNSKIKTDMFVQGVGKQKKEVHKVQILDPATGTGTFLAEVVKHIHEKFKGQQGIWSSYAEDHLIPRLNGFEILMASYAMAHLKLGLLLKETGFQPKKQERFKIFLTNSLEEAHEGTGTLFERWLSKEASEANSIKQDTPVMVVIGNPPYSVSSMNKGEWIQALLKDYKKDLKEKKINLDDDYIKFIRYAQHYIEKVGYGIVAMITNNSFIDGITHRQMRKSLLETFDKIYILDLHGNSKKQETCPDGSKDENVFDIMQGVSINIFIKKTKSKKDAIVYHVDFFGLRKNKYDELENKVVSSVNMVKIDCKAPYYFFVPKDFEAQKQYGKYFKLSNIFMNGNSGVETGKDNFIVKYSDKELNNLLFDINNLNIDDIIVKYHIKKDKVEQVLGDLEHSRQIDIQYRPFDLRKTLYSKNSQGVLWRPRHKTMFHFIGKNIGLIIKRGFDEDKSAPCYISKYILDRRGWSRPGMQGAESIFPLYLYTEDDKQQNIDNEPARTPNLNPETVKKISESLNLSFTPEKEEKKGTFAPIDILDYIYAVLHSPAYRETYKEFLKIDFPRVPYPKDEKTFWQLVKIGGELRTVHLLENPIVEQYITAYPEDGDNTLTRSITRKDFEITDKKKKTGRVWINDSQYFAEIPLTAWEFYIGGYRPAQKWLKDRKGRTLNFDEILHYQKIIAALHHTDMLMKKIDKIKFM
jgi:predicted helicase